MEKIYSITLEAFFVFRCNLYLHLIWVLKDVCGLFANKVVSLSFNVGRSVFIFADNVVSKNGCLQFLVIMFAGRYRYADDGVVHCRSEAEALHMLEVLKHRFQSCGLELHPVKTKIVYCKDGSRKGHYEQTSFDFLGYTFRRRLCRNSKRNSVFVNFTPAVSKTAMKSMRQRVRELRVRARTELSLGQVAKWLNPIINGWIAYYGCYTRSALYGLCRHVNMTLVRWARRKFKTLRRHKVRAIQFLMKIADQYPSLFAHWRIGMTGAFA